MSGLFVGYSGKSGYICRLSKENYTSMVLDYISKTNKEAHKSNIQTRQEDCH